MISYEDFCEIKKLHEREGLNSSRIAGELGLDKRTATKWIEEKEYRPGKSSHRPSKLDPFKDDIVRMLETHSYTATQVFQRIKEEGFDGGYTIVKEYVRKVRPRRAKPFLKLSFAPGECAQVDWGSYGSVPVGETFRRLSFFVMVLKLQQIDICRVHRVPENGAFPGLPSKRFSSFWRHPRKDHGRQSEIRGFKTGCRA